MNLHSLTWVMAGPLLICLCIASVTAARVAGICGTLTSGSGPLAVTFKDTSGGSPTGRAWFFGDENWMVPSTPVNASDGGLGRQSHSSVVMPDGTIILMGGLLHEIRGAVL